MRYRWVLVVGLGCVACGKVSNKPADAPVQIDSPRGIDAAIDSPPPRCNPNAPFGTPVPLSTINTADSEESAYLSPDELTLYFSSTRSGTLGSYDIFMATRASRDLAFGNVTPVAGVNTTGLERAPIVTGDGLTMYALIGTDPNYEIGVATRSSTSASFSALSVVANINSSANDIPTFVLANDSALYFYSNSSGNYDMYRVPRTGGQFGTPLPVSGAMLNTASVEADAVVSPDELTIYFTSDRAGGVGMQDVYMATRTTTANGFDTPINLQSLNTTGNEQPTWISDDGCVIYLTVGPCCAYDLMVATRGM